MSDYSRQFGARKTTELMPTMRIFQAKHVKRKVSNRRAIALMMMFTFARLRGILDYNRVQNRISLAEKQRR